MSTYQPVPVSDAAQISLKRSKDVVVILTMNHEHQRATTTTYGRTAKDKVVAGVLGDKIAKLLDIVDQFTTHEDFRSMEEAAVNKVAAEDAVKFKAMIREKLEKIVCTKPPDDGVVIMDGEGRCHPDPVTGIQTYDHVHFSELGDALMELWRLCQ